RALRTEPADPQVIEAAIKGMYRAANLAEPRVIVVPSPLVMAIAGGIATFWWYMLENNLFSIKSKRKAAPFVATFDGPDKTLGKAYYPITSAYVATYDATEAATDEATYKATREATAAAYHADSDAIIEAIIDVADDTIYAATSKVICDLTIAATEATTRGAITDWFD